MRIELIIFCLFAWVGMSFSFYRLAAKQASTRREPKELHDAQLIFAEQAFWANEAISIVAKVDRAYLARDGLIVLVELKTRSVNRAYYSDVIELSAQRYALQGQTGRRVAMIAYVVIQRSGSDTKFFHRVNLLATDKIIRLAKRREEILQARTAAYYAVSKGICKQCPFRLQCDSD